MSGGSFTDMRTMHHFHHLDDAARDTLFLHLPRPFSDADERERLAVALGATLYVPATRTDLAATIARRSGEGVASMVIDLEDAVADHEVEDGLRNAVATLDALAGTAASTMLLFVRVRTPDGVDRIAETLGPGVAALTGFVLPKFTAASGPAFLDAVAVASERLGKHLYAMPVLESASWCTGRPATASSSRSPRSWPGTATACWPCGSAPPTCAPPSASAATAT